MRTEKAVDLYMVRKTRAIKGNTKEVTREMVDDLISMPASEFARKHNTSEAYFYKLYHEFTEFTKETLEEEEEEVLEEIAAEKFFDGIFPEEEIMFEKGFNAYRTYLQEKQSYWDSACADILHKIELAGAEDDSERIVLFNMLKNAREHRRMYHNGYEFISKETSSGRDNSVNIKKIHEMLELKNNIKNFRKLLNERKYGVRVLKAEFGSTISK